MATSTAKPKTHAHLPQPVGWRVYNPSLHTTIWPDDLLRLHLQAAIAPRFLRYDLVADVKGTAKWPTVLYHDREAGVCCAQAELLYGLLHSVAVVFYFHCSWQITATAMLTWITVVHTATIQRLNMCWNSHNKTTRYRQWFSCAASALAFLCSLCSGAPTALGEVAASLNGNGILYKVRIVVIFLFTAVAMAVQWGRWGRRPVYDFDKYVGLGGFVALFVFGLCLAAPPLGMIVAPPLIACVGGVLGTVLVIMLANPMVAEGNPLEGLSWVLFGGHALAFVVLRLGTKLT